MRKQARTPRVPATRPPSAAPTASMVPQDAPDRTLAVARSSGPTRLGSAAVPAGWANALAAATRAIPTSATQAVPRLSTSSRSSAASPAAVLATTSTRRRSSRSTTVPAYGDTSAKAAVSAVSTSAPYSPPPVISGSRTSSGTTANQSPPSAMSVATYSRRKSGSRRSRSR